MSFHFSLMTGLDIWIIVFLLKGIISLKLSSKLVTFLKSLNISFSSLILSFSFFHIPDLSSKEQLFKKNKINLVVDQKYFPTSLNKIQKLNVEFSASFGRQLEYYTGMVFKIDIKSKSKNINIINGGRYDKLISDLGSKKQVPAVGAALNLNY